MVAPQIQVNPGIETGSLPLGRGDSSGSPAAWIPGRALITPGLTVNREAFKTVCKETVSHLLCLAVRCFTELMRSLIRRRLFSCLNGKGMRSRKAS